MIINSSISILGTGDAGTTLGNALQKLGYNIIFGSRNPSNGFLRNSEVCGLEESVRKSDIIINTIPGEHVLMALEAIGSSLFKNKILIDVSVALTDGNLTYPTESGAEKIQKFLPETFVVKALCTMTATVMVNPRLLSAPTTVFLSGNHDKAKKTVSYILQDLGWDIQSQIDLGDIKTARGQEHFALLYFNLYEHLGHGSFNIKVYLDN